ncbi:MAG: tRNA (adenosine(37)-N6)-threonylcarbamoyltransferase complex ATPase subunit type 1 TsaE [Desulfamplus sp.]|nr:tRNA (adenosine(37)-N6)-threonylcarbamoyltransferase complex ATPase subunit type 1 TsaE [Desulfamplus sp.]
MSIKFTTDSGHSTNEIGRKLGALIVDNLNSSNMDSKKIAIALYGDLGAGKTTFVQGFARGLGVPENYYVTSPTYNIINEYPIDISKNSNGILRELCKKLTLYHIDLYRIGSPDELEYIGFDDIASSDNSVIIIEWPDMIDSGSRNIIIFDLEIHIQIDQEFNREISFIPYGLDAINLLKEFV